MTNMPQISAANCELIAKLRVIHKKELTVAYATDFNLLRWLQASGGDLDAASQALGRHLKVVCRV